MAGVNESTREPALEPITIVGASVRAAAWSARRAHFAPTTADLFADLDLCELAQARRVTHYPLGLEAGLHLAAGGGWMYCGGIENYPDLIEGWSRLRPLYGNSAETVRRVRDPWQAAACMAQAGIHCPELAPGDAGLSRDGSWLRKPLQSAGGQRIVRVEASTPPADWPCYFQRQVSGFSFSAAYVAAGGVSRLLGVTRQLLTPGSFSYCGSIGPVSLPAAVLDQVELLGQALARQFSLLGLFGVDAVLADGDVWPVEINPRYTASMEVLERVLGFSAVAWHVAACREGRLPDKMPPTPRVIVGKQIVFAETDAVIRDDLRRQLTDIADVPQPGQVIAAGSPVLTVMRGGASSDEVAHALTVAATAATTALRMP